MCTVSQTYMKKSFLFTKMRGKCAHLSRSVQGSYGWIRLFAKNSVGRFSKGNFDWITHLKTLAKDE